MDFSAEIHFFFAREIISLFFREIHLFHKLFCLDYSKQASSPEYVQ